jgi:hypothetical protein
MSASAQTPRLADPYCPLGAAEVIRRKFIRVVGGGFIAAAAATSAGCSHKMPSGAVEARKGPTQEADVRRSILGHGILAPKAL